jgi:hypothetical protein
MKTHLDTRLLERIVPAATGDSKAGPVVKQRSVPAEAALAELRKYVVREIDKAHRAKRDNQRANNQGGYFLATGKINALAEIKNRIDRSLSARDAGGNAQGHLSQPGASVAANKGTESHGN